MTDETFNNEIDPTTKKIQFTIKNIFSKFVEICNDNQLRYYPIDGSLLGAIRHKGFIPWDDDIDVGMPFPDYEKLCQIAKDQLPDNMYLVTYEESLKAGSIAEIARIYCTDLRLKVGYFEKEESTYAWMDIMIMFGMPSNKLLRWFHYKHSYIVKSIARLGRVNHVGRKKHSFIEKIGILFAKKFDMSKIIDSEKWMLKNIKILTKFTYDQSSYIIVFPSEYGSREILLKNYYEPAVKGEFEDLIIRVPKNSDAILKKLYGNYMHLPPESEQHSKHRVTLLGNNEIMENMENNVYGEGITSSFENMVKCEGGGILANRSDA